MGQGKTRKKKLLPTFLMSWHTQKMIMHSAQMVSVCSLGQIDGIVVNRSNSPATVWKTWEITAQIKVITSGNRHSLDGLKSGETWAQMEHFAAVFVQQWTAWGPPCGFQKWPAPSGARSNPCNMFAWSYVFMKVPKVGHLSQNQLAYYLFSPPTPSSPHFPSCQEASVWLQHSVFTYPYFSSWTVPPKLKNSGPTKPTSLCTESPAHPDSQTLASVGYCQK